MKKYLFLITILLFGLSLKALNIPKIYIAGDAMTCGWTNSNPEVMEVVDANQGIYIWSGYVTIGEFKFLLDLGKWSNCLNATTDKETVVMGEEHVLAHVPNYFESGNDYSFQITEEGVYTITVNTKEMKMVVEKNVNLEVPNDLWITGSAVSGNVVKLVEDPNQIPGCFRYNGKFESGEFKIMNTPKIQSNTKFYVPVSEDANVAGSQSMQITDNVNLPGWKVTIPDDSYKIKINTITETVNGEIFIVRNDLFIVGGATEVGWDAKHAIRLKKDANNPNLYLFSGVLKEAESGEDRNMFKLLGQKDWEPISFHPKTQNENLSTSQYIFKNYPGDHKWVIDLNKQGEYTIEVDLLNEMISTKYNMPIQVESKNELDADYIISTKNRKVHVRSKTKIGFDYVRLLDDNASPIISSENEKSKFSIGKKLKKGIYLIELSQNNKVSIEKVVIK